MIKLFYIFFVLSLATTSLGSPYNKKNKVYAIDIHRLISALYQAQTNPSQLQRQAEMTIARKIFDRVSRKLSLEQKDKIASKLNSSVVLTTQDYEELIDQISIDFELNRAPPSPPRFEDGKLKYEKFCASCHGSLGDGDGIVAHKFKNKNLSLHRENLSPFRCYNQNIAANPSAGKSGILTAVTEPGLWNVCFYVLTLKMTEASSKSIVQKQHPLTLEKLSTGTRRQYGEWSKTYKVPTEELHFWPYSNDIERK